MSKPFRALAAAVLITLAAAPAAQAHRSWLAPSATVLSGQDPWVTVDGAVSNTLFYADHVAMRLDGVSVVGPDGQPVEIKNGSTGRYRSTFDVQLAKPGTYKIANVSEGASASYKLGGETKRWRGRADEIATAIPKEAADVQITHNVRRVETFVTAGAPNTEALKPTGRGLELEPITHPNDLVASEPAKFRLLHDGKPAADVEVEVVLGDTRYRDKGVELKVKTGADGVFQISWPEPGLYWLEASAQGQDAAGGRRSAGYVATLEVLPD
jgi:ABC-type Co2+ transport system, periplasmic component